MKKIKKLNFQILKCLAELNKLCSIIMNNEIQSELRISLYKQQIYIEFSKFKKSVTDFKSVLEKFKECKFEHKYSKSLLMQIAIVQTKTETTISNVKHIMTETAWLDFKREFEVTVQTLIDSINIYMDLIKEPEIGRF
ncbi:MAG: hypothetical protein IK024_10795 [Treponema sp.]|nr:hypothetical protein [Treponema sp.]